MQFVVASHPWNHEVKLLHHLVAGQVTPTYKVIGPLGTEREVLKESDKAWRWFALGSPST